MMKPISTFGQTALRNSQLRRIEGDLATATNELSSGKKSDVAKALGSELINLQTIRNQYSENEGYMRSIDLFKQRYDLMDGALAEAEAGIESLVQVAVLNANDAIDSAGAVPMVAQTAIDRVITALNVQLGGRYLFGGAAVDNQTFQPRDKANAGGLSPADVAEQVTRGTTGVAGFPVTDLTTPTTLAEATELLQRFDDIFQGTNAGNPTPGAPVLSFENTVYNGDIAGELLSIRLPNNAIGVDLDDQMVQGLRDVLQGAYMLASVDLESITDEGAYRELMTGEGTGRDGALDLITGGLMKLQRTRTDLGLHYRTVDAADEAIASQQALLNNQITNLEGVDRAEVTTRLLDIENQLEASYAVTGRVMKLTLFNYVR